MKQLDHGRSRQSSIRQEAASETEKSPETRGMPQRESSSEEKRDGGNEEKAAPADEGTSLYNITALPSKRGSSQYKLK